MIRRRTLILDYSEVLRWCLRWCSSCPVTDVCYPTSPWSTPPSLSRNSSMHDGVSKSKLTGMSRDMAEEFHFSALVQFQLVVSELRLSLPPVLSLTRLCVCPRKRCPLIFYNTSNALIFFTISSLYVQDSNPYCRTEITIEHNDLNFTPKLIFWSFHNLSILTGDGIAQSCSYLYFISGST